jgi:hypothetical protein
MPLAYLELLVRLGIVLAELYCLKDIFTSHGYALLLASGAAPVDICASGDIYLKPPTSGGAS